MARDAVGSTAGRPRILVVDDRYVSQGLGAGYQRMLAIVEELVHFADVTFHPTFIHGRAGDPSDLRSLGATLHEGALTALLERPGRFDAVLVSRPANFERCALTVRALQPQAALIYDAEALFHRRMEVEAALRGDPLLADAAAAMRQLEAAIAREADLLVAVSRAEADWLGTVPGGAPVRYVAATRTGGVLTTQRFDERSDLLFVGGWIAGPHSPNVDALTWFCDDVLPGVRARRPWTRLLVTGADPPPAVLARRGPFVRFTGHVQDLAAVYGRARVVVSPMRIGAGVKMKTIDAIVHGVPTVSTTVGAEGIELVDPEALVVTDDATGMIGACLDLLTSRASWLRRRRAVERCASAWATAAPTSWSAVVADARRSAGRPTPEAA